MSRSLYRENTVHRAVKIWIKSIKNRKMDEINRNAADEYVNIQQKKL